jgi:hypothetical protein
VSLVAAAGGVVIVTDGTGVPAGRGLLITIGAP